MTPNPVSMRVAPPGAGAPAGVGGPPSAPPASVPLTFLFAAGIGAIGFAVVLVANASVIVDSPTAPRALATVHLGLLAFLSTAVLGALHQFSPVVGLRPLRSIPAARVTALVWVVGAWLLPLGFAAGPDVLVPIAGCLAFSAVLLAAWNLSGPLSSRGKGTPLVGLRFGVAFLVVTASFGVVYAFDRNAGWFDLYTNRVLAHAHLGLLGWLGLVYVSVAEKLWPMFLLAHRPKARSGAWAVRLFATGVPVLALGLLFGWKAVAVVGGAVVAAGMGAHLLSLAGVIRHRRRKFELLHAFVIAAAVCMVCAVVLGAAAGLGSMGYTARSRLVSAEVAALFGWITLAIVGHAHKIVPFISWGVLRKAGVTKTATGAPLLFAHLFDARAARATFVVIAAGVVALVSGTASGSTALVTAAGVAIAVAAVVASANLTTGPIRARRAAKGAS